jgi:hypothetical protein
VWWKRLKPRLFADITIVGLLPAFSIGRIGCTVVSDHIGSAVDPTKWYSFLAMDYPRRLNLGHLAEHYPNLTGETIKAWNLGLIEFLYLIPVNALILWLAFRPLKVQPEVADKAPEKSGRPNAGMLTVLTGILYAPVRFFLDYLRPEDSDPRHMGLTFAQWISILAFGVACYVLFRIMKNGSPEIPRTMTSGEMQRRLKMVLKEAEEEEAAKAKEPKSPLQTAKAQPAKKTAEEKAAEKEEEELAKEALAAKPADESAAAAAADTAAADDTDDDDDDEAAKPASPSPPVGAAKPVVTTSGGRKHQTAGSKKKKKKR